MSLRLALAALLLLCAAVVAAAQENLEITGYVETDNRLTIESDRESVFNYNENTLAMIFKAWPADRVTIYGSFQLDAIGVDERLDDDQLTIGQQQDRAAVDPVRLELDEAYLEINGLWLRNLDVRIGKQRIAWGTGDQFNPTDNLNPDDMHDPLQFGRKLASPAVRATYYAGPVTITGVVVPLFEPVLLPQTDIRPIFEAMFETMADEFAIDTGDAALDVIFKGMMIDAIKGARIGDVNVHSKLPSRAAKNANAGARLSGTVGSVDLSASSAWVRDDFGVPKRIAMNVAPLSTGLKIVDEIDLDVEQRFPRLQVIGADFATQIPVLDVGFWGEAAYFIPERMKTEYYLDAGSLNTLLSTFADEDFDKGLVIAEDEPLDENYLKAVSGVDYTFPGSWYVNAQYIRGLPNDNTAEAVDNYAFGGVDKPFFHDTIKPRVFSGVCFDDESWVLYPQVFFYPLDSVELHAGVFLVFGEVDTKFGAFGDDLAFLRAKVSF